ncbi:hypothetical protein A9A72_1231230 [Stutzerimonas stutzeri]|jgi:hypothetical protein|uniref:Uncharacterized protein n=1 Tax=Stutzerimonas stutzeri TaxID=316 RepID=A0A5S5BFH7_STUST|nr:hypothetical protein A9A72_1231230 [Stutzerimonas stutzeri]
MRRIKRGRNSGLARDFLLESVWANGPLTEYGEAGLRLSIEVHPLVCVGEPGHEKEWGWD